MTAKTTSAEEKPPYDPYNRNCPSRKLLDRAGDRWTILIVGILAKSEKSSERFSTLAKKVDGVSQKMLTQTLRALERDGIVTREVFAEVPPRVEYALTPLGRSLRVVHEQLEKWTCNSMPQVEAALEAYDRVSA